MQINKEIFKNGEVCLFHVRLFFQKQLFLTLYSRICFFHSPSIAFVSLPVDVTYMFRFSCKHFRSSALSFFLSPLTSKRSFTRHDVSRSTLSRENFFKSWNHIEFSSVVTKVGSIRKLCTYRGRNASGNALLGPECEAKFVTSRHNKRQNIFPHTHRSIKIPTVCDLLQINTTSSNITQISSMS
jgi:hypothetical protein